jgi:hypothetical protein
MIIPLPDTGASHPGTRAGTGSEPMKDTRDFPGRNQEKSHLIVMKREKYNHENR